MRRYLNNFIDRASLGQARLGSLEADLGMTGTQFNLSISILFVGYLLNLEMRCILCCLFSLRLLLTRELVLSTRKGSVHSLSLTMPRQRRPQVVRFTFTFNK
jgi:hypothetical protein